MDTKDRRIPFVHELMRGVRECTLSRSVLLFPVRSTHIPIGEPHLFRFQILHFHIKDTIVGDILDIAPETAPAFIDIGMHCLGCPSSRGETVEEACMVHGIDVEKLLALVNEEANKPVKE